MCAGLATHAFGQRLLGVYRARKPCVDALEGRDSLPFERRDSFDPVSLSSSSLAIDALRVSPLEGPCLFIRDRVSLLSKSASLASKSVSPSSNPLTQAAALRVFPVEGSKDHRYSLNPIILNGLCSHEKGSERPSCFASCESLASRQGVSHFERRANSI